MQAARMGFTRRRMIVCALAAVWGTGMTAQSTAVPQSTDMNGIAHVSIRSSDLKSTLNFYGKLGLEQAFAFGDPDHPKQVFLKINDTQFIEIYPQYDHAEPSGFGHVCFEGQDLKTLNESYVKAGLAPTEVRKAAAGNLLFTLDVPDSPNLEYTQYLSGSKHMLDKGLHLGPDRIGKELVGVLVVRRDASGLSRLFESKLGFKTTTDPRTLLLPGVSGQFFSFEMGEDESQASLYFHVLNVKETKAKLKKLGLNPHLSGKEVSVHDPNGITVVYTSDPLPAAR